MTHICLRNCCDIDRTMYKTRLDDDINQPTISDVSRWPYDLVKTLCLLYRGEIFILYKYQVLLLCAIWKCDSTNRHFEYFSPQRLSVQQAVQQLLAVVSVRIVALCYVQYLIGSESVKRPSITNSPGWCKSTRTMTLKVVTWIAAKRLRHWHPSSILLYNEKVFLAHACLQTLLYIVWSTNVGTRLASDYIFTTVSRTYNEKLHVSLYACIPDFIKNLLQMPEIFEFRR